MSLTVSVVVLGPALAQHLPQLQLGVVVSIIPAHTDKDKVKTDLQRLKVDL